jgi:Cyclin-dependent kinase inhibitor
MLRDEEFGDLIKNKCFAVADYEAFELMVSTDNRVSELSDQYNFNFANDEPAKESREPSFKWEEVPQLSHSHGML